MWVNGIVVAYRIHDLILYLLAIIINDSPGKVGDIWGGNTKQSPYHNYDTIYIVFPGELAKTRPLPSALSISKS